MVLLVAWVLVGVALRGPEATLAFEFLGGRTMTLHLEGSGNRRDPNRVTREIYSFEMDSNSIGMDANEELLALGFVERPLPWPQWNGRCYRRVEPSGEVVTVRVIEQHKAFEHPLASGVEYCLKQGWVSVEVMRERRSVWRDVLRGPVNLLYRWGLLR